MDDPYSRQSKKMEVRVCKSKISKRDGGWRME